MRHAKLRTYEGPESITVGETPRKGDVLRFMKSVPYAAVAAGPFTDVFTGEIHLDYLAYKSGDWSWTNADTFYLERYDALLDPDFVAYALSQVDSAGEAEG